VTSTESFFSIRPADEKDAVAITAVNIAARRAAVPAMPPPIHSDEEIRGWIGFRLQGGDEVWAAEEGGTVVGYARVTPGWLDDLYVLPAASGRGIGSALLDVVKAQHQDGFSLWVFVSNTPARRFYERRGLVELEHTAGERNEERAPDLRMAWPGADPVDYLRAQIDEVDDDLAWVVSRRAALTAAIQHYKDVGGHAGRDPDREDEIARRLAARSAGPLDAEAWRRIIHEVISVSLDAASETGPSST
jgi:chorismate mutase/GNAT superfamily N-acetyltransferase